MAEVLPMWEPKIVRKSLRAAGFWAFPNREPVKVELYRLDWNFTEDFVVAVSGDGEGAGIFQMQPGVRFPKVSDGGRQYGWSFNDQEDQLFISLKDAIDYGRSFNGNGSIAWSALASDNTDYTREIESAEAESIVGACLGAAEPIGYRSEPTKTTIDFETNDGTARLITFVDYWTGDEIGDKRIGLPEKRVLKNKRRFSRCMKKSIGGQRPSIQRCQPRGICT